MYEYGHGGNVAFEPNGEQILDLSANINPLGVPQGIDVAIHNEVQFLNRYPDCYSTRLRKKIASYEDIPAEWIFCSNGASDIIFRIPIALRSKRALVLAPTFSDYERSLKSFGAYVVYHSLEKESDFNVDYRLMETLKQHDVDLVFICNPNNPTGVLTDIALIEQLLCYCKERGVVVIIDECFMDFALCSEKYTSKRLLNQYDNLIILKAFTKIFAMPGIRLGYAICNNRSIIQKLYVHGADWAISNLAQGAGIAALENAHDYISQTVAYVDIERKFLKENLTSLGFKVFDSRANYVFFNSPYELDLYTELNKRNIRIRSCHNYNGLSGYYYRTAVSTHNNNKNLITTLREILVWQNR